MFPYYFHPRALSTVDRPWRPKAEDLKPNCPRCDSTNTKFCYYNNYCLTQPRYLCKGCRRYWTKGGSLRNVPAGGGRKSRRGKPAKINSTVSSSLSSPPNSLRPDHALETMSGRTGERFVLPDQSVDLSQLYANFFNQCSELEKQEEAVPKAVMSPFDQESFETQNRAEIGAEAPLRNNYVEQGIIGEKKNFLNGELMEVKRREFGGMMMDSSDNYLIGSNDYASETDLIWESSRFQGIGISVMAQQNDVGLASLEAFL